MKFFTRLKNSVINFEQYINFSSEKITVGIKYFILIMLMFSLILTIAFTYRAYDVINSGDIDLIYEEFVYGNNIELVTRQSLEEIIEETHWATLLRNIFRN